MRHVSVFGLGYVGAVTAACLASRGSQVVGVDVNPRKVEMFQSGRAPVLEPGLEDLVVKGCQSGRLRATTDTAALSGTPRSRSSASEPRACITAVLI